MRGLEIEINCFESQGDFFFFDFAHFQKSKPNFSLSLTLCFSFYGGAFQDFDELFWDWNCSFSEIVVTFFKDRWYFYFWRDFWFGRLFKYRVFLLFDQYQDPFKKIRILKITLSNFRLAPPLNKRSIPLPLTETKLNFLLLKSLSRKIPKLLPPITKILYFL